MLCRSCLNCSGNSETRLGRFCQCMIRDRERGEKTDDEMNRQSIEHMDVWKDTDWTCVVV